METNEFFVIIFFRIMLGLRLFDKLKWAVEKTCIIRQEICPYNTQVKSFKQTVHREHA